MGDCPVSKSSYETRLGGPKRLVMPRQGTGPDPITRPLHAVDAVVEQPLPAVRTLTPVWRSRMARRLAVSDSVLLLLVTFAVQVLWLGPHWSYPVANGGSSRLGALSYSLLSAGIGVCWLTALKVSGSRSHRVFGTGVEEYRRIFTASAWVFGLLAVFAYSLQYDVARGYVAITFPLGVAVLCAERCIWRHWLNAHRESGTMVSRVLVVGTEDGAAALGRHIERDHTSGLKVAGVFRTSGLEGAVAPHDVLLEAARMQANSVVVTTSAHIEPHQLRELRWSLEELGADLIIAPALMGLAGQRLHTQPIEGLPLLHVDGARYDGSMRIVKGVVDRLGAGTALLLLSPLLLAVAILVKATSTGPAFYRQSRVGREGHTFSIWKFRSMTDGADALLMELLRENDGARTPLFKLNDDRRVTPVGRFLRKWSIDELPQLFNVVFGDMSLVGPRPQRPEEVALYDDAALRRLRVKPGLTGLWQVSGRSDVPWERAVELDLYYVENWSLSYDLILMWRTISVVLKAQGAH
ncbi:MAG: wcnC [Nocardioidaceae bacterium]|nr:wcnC [Nocardioidaceae bacterium]